MTNLFEVARLLSEGDVRFVIVGGIAIRSHGGSYITEDLDICYDRARENLKKLAAVLGPLNPRPRGIDKQLPFIFDWSTLNQGTNFTFMTSMGDVDLLGEVKGIGSYQDLVKMSIDVNLDGFITQILSIPGLIIAKEASGRAKDEAGLKILYALRDSELSEE
ncbi:MAG: hypothetical protein ABIO91_05150 [Pyrinomonadaceae bacterium]